MGLTNEDINNKIIKIWKEKYDGQARIPHLYSPFNIGGILFIGLNPSILNLSKIKKTLEEKYEDQAKAILEDLKHLPKYLKDLSAESISEITEMTSIIKEVHPYFAKCREISKETGINWEHIDLFFEKETNQKNVIHDYVEEESFNSKNIKLDKFAEEQLEISMLAIEAIEPKIIVVINALASKILKQQYKEDKLSKLDEDKGFYTVKLNNKDIPIFFSGMLTGQRALDDGSYERLKWHIRSALKNIRE